MAKTLKELLKQKVDENYCTQCKTDNFINGICIKCGHREFSVTIVPEEDRWHEVYTILKDIMTSKENEVDIETLTTDLIDLVQYGIQNSCS